MKTLYMAKGSTEELAELHVIIQAIAYQRGERIADRYRTTPWILDKEDD